jgi:RimJ/RimL family protein N-acetyltransferase
MSSGPFLMTKRLILRPTSAEDFDGWANFCADPETMRFLGGIQSRAESWRSLCMMAGAWTIRGYAMFSLIRRDTGAWIGRVGPWYPDGWPAQEIGWGILREYAGQGYAQEAAAASMDYAFDVLGWDKVIHIIDPENAGSIALAERLGSANRGPTQMPAPFDTFRVDAYGQTKTEWTARRAAHS